MLLLSFTYYSTGRQNSDIQEIHQQNFQNFLEELAPYGVNEETTKEVYSYSYSNGCRIEQASHREGGFHWEESCYMQRVDVTIQGD